MADETEKHAGGRPTLITDEVKRKLGDALRLGATRGDASEYAGIGKSTFMRWMADAEKPGKRFDQYREIRDLVTTAEATMVIDNLAVVRQDISSNKDGRLALELLGRRRRTDYGPPRAQESVVQVGTLAESADGSRVATAVQIGVSTAPELEGMTSSDIASMARELLRQRYMQKQKKIEGEDEDA